MLDGWLEIWGKHLTVIYAAVINAKACLNLGNQNTKINRLNQYPETKSFVFSFNQSNKQIDISSRLQDAEHVGYPLNNESQLCLSLAKTLEMSMGGSSGAVSSLTCCQPFECQWNDHF